MKIAHLVFGFGIALGSLAEAQTPPKSVQLKGEKAVQMVGAMLSAGLKEKNISGNVYRYSVNKFSCTSSNHGGPGGFGISYSTGCFTETTGFGKGKRIYDASKIMELAEEAASGASVELGDCATGKCMISVSKIDCDVDTSKEVSNGCDCTVHF